MSYDPHYANVSLLLPGDGADNGTVFTDNSPSPKTVTAYGNAKTSTAQSKFGGSSIAFDGSGDYLSVPGSSGEFSFGTGDFTIEFWARWSSVASEDAICFGDGIGWTLYIYPAGKLQWGRTSPQSPANLLASSSSVTTGQWYHIAVTRESGVVKFWIDGNASGSVSDTANYSANGTLNIGKSHAGAWFQGWIDDFRVTKGVSRYTGNFTPPTEPFTNPAPTIELIASASTPLGAAYAYAQSCIVSQAQASTPLGSALAFAFSGQISFAAADTPLGSVSALSVVVSACRIASSGPLGVPATLARYSIEARVSAASPLGIAQSLAWHDFTGQIGDTATRYVMDLITPSGTVRVPISSWQATLRTGASSYVQCVIPAAQPWGAIINAATSFRIYRRAVTTGGQVFEYMMAEAPADTPQFDRGPTNPTCTLSGYAPGFAGQDVSPGTDRTLTGIRSISSGASYRVRCAVDWLLRPGQRGVVDGVPFVVEWINYYVNKTDAYMEVGT